jgi:predicted transcriptional regulator
MLPTTTIKVPRALHKRLAAEARAQHLTLAAVISRALDDADERRFWAAVQKANDALTTEDRSERLVDRTVADDLDDPNDDELSLRGTW